MFNFVDAIVNCCFEVAHTHARAEKKQTVASRNRNCATETTGKIQFLQVDSANWWCSLLIRQQDGPSCAAVMISKAKLCQLLVQYGE
jgi:hypothetical protein